MSRNNVESTESNQTRIASLGRGLSFFVPFSLYAVLSFTRYDKFNATLALASGNALLNGFLYQKSIVDEATQFAEFIRKMKQGEFSEVTWKAMLLNGMKFYAILNLTAVASLLLTGDLLANKKDFPAPMIWTFGLLGWFLEGVLAITPNRAIINDCLKIVSINRAQLSTFAINREMIFKAITGLVVAFLSFFFTLGSVGSVQRALEWDALSWMKYPFPLLFLIQNQTVSPIAAIGIFFLFTFYTTKSFVSLLPDMMCPKQFHFGNWFLRILLFAMSVATTQASSAIQIEGQNRVLAWHNMWSTLVAFINKIHITPDVLAGVIGGGLNVSGVLSSLDKAQSDYKTRAENDGPKKCSDYLLKWITPKPLSTPVTDENRVDYVALTV